MKKSRRLQLTSLPFRNFVLAAFSLSLATILLVIILHGRLPPQVPLFYGLAQGEEQLVASYGLILPSTASFLIVVLNITLANFLKSDFLKKILILTGFVTASFASITTIKIILLVGSF